jgi:hypothetical protein
VFISPTIEVGPWEGGVSVRSSENSFPMWNVVIATDGSTRTFLDTQEGRVGEIISETPPVQLQSWVKVYEICT